MRLLAVVMLTVAVLVPESAGACETASPEFLQVDVSPSLDTVPPEPPLLREVRINRSYGPREDGCSRSGSSCDGSGTLGIQIEPGHDDRAAPEELGYLVRLREGRLPGGATPRDRPVLLLSGGLYVSFPDPGPDEQESIELTFEVIAVDRAGNESALTVARATSPGDEGCAFAGGAPSGVLQRLAMIMALSVLVVRRWLRRSSLAEHTWRADRRAL